MKIYLAGPDVFRKDAIEYGQHLKALCNDHGHIGLFPFDNEIRPHHYPYQTAREIFIANIKMIRQCDMVIANLNPFRGPSADVGTIWEVGFALGLGKQVLGYRDPHTCEYIHRVRPVDSYLSEYPNIEDFSLIDNLMIDCSVSVFPSFEAALKHLTMTGSW